MKRALAVPPPTMQRDASVPAVDPGAGAGGHRQLTGRVQTLAVPLLLWPGW